MVLERFKIAVDYLIQEGEINKWQDLVDAIGMSKYSILKAMKGIERYSTESIIERFCAKYNNINYDWLIDGEGEMLNNNE